MDFATSVVRTIVPFLVALLGPKAAAWFGIDASQLDATLTVLVGGVYYAVIRLLELYVPQFGWLLGIARPPAYDGATAKHAA